jgi:hypothetical protein
MVSQLLAVPHPETNAARLVGLLEYARLKGRPLRRRIRPGLLRVRLSRATSLAKVEGVMRKYLIEAAAAPLHPE